MACFNEAQKLYLHRVAQEGQKPNATLLSLLGGDIDAFTILSLRNTYVGDAGVVALSRSLHLLKNLAVLDIRDNGVSNAACPVLCSACQRLENLRVLDLSRNKLITRKGGKELLDLIASHASLLWIDVDDTMVSHYYQSRIVSHGERKLERLPAELKEKWKQFLSSMRSSRHAVPELDLSVASAPAGALDDIPPEEADIPERQWKKSDRPLSSHDAVLTMPAGFVGHVVVHNHSYDEEWLCDEEWQPVSPIASSPDQPGKTYIQEGSSTICISKDPQHNRVIFGFALPTKYIKVSPEITELFELIHTYEPKEIEIDTPFKFPGKLNYMTAVGGPESFLDPTPPSELPPQEHCAPENNSMYWSFMTSSTPAATREQLPPVNPHDNLQASIQNLQTEIYYANIAPPTQYITQLQPSSAEAQANDENEESTEEAKGKVATQHFDGLYLASDRRCLSPTVSSSVVRYTTSSRPPTPATPAAGIPCFSTRTDSLTPEDRHKSAVEKYLDKASLQINAIQPLILRPAPGNLNGYHLHRVVKPTVGCLSRAARLTSGALNNTGSKLATGSYDLTAKVWDGNSGELLNTLSGHEGYVYDVIWNTPFCDRLITASFDKTCKIWNAETGECVHTLTGHDLEVVCVAVNKSSTLIASGSMDQTVIIWNALTGGHISMLQGHSAEIVCVDFSPANDLLASGSADETVRLWHSLTGECLALFEGHTGEVAAVKFNCHGNLVLSCSADATCRLWDTNTKRCKALKGHSKDVSDCEFSADGWLVASASEDMSARVWDTLSAGCISMMKGHTMGICCVSFGDGGKELLTGSADMTCRRWKVSTGECLQVLSGHKSVVISSYSFDGSVILTISKDNSCRLWRRDSPNHSLVDYILQYICSQPVLQSEVIEDSRLPKHLKYRLKRAEGRLIDFVTPPPSPNLFFNYHVDGT
eukprot:TRINITY_DN18984_c0_g1_i1.p1 TRINITY_DN18984_c0_g1~~TRINITY_DN18984_c0_g1_i1.p1  ORF type:complete len:942 (+),score=253.68 TRINITY_DN18984_c0_g1_i1:29-2827(+)